MYLNRPLCQDLKVDWITASPRLSVSIAKFRVLTNAIDRRMSNCPLIAKFGVMAYSLRITDLSRPTYCRLSRLLEYW